MEQEKIIQLIAGQLTDEERKEILEWISASDENREEYYRLKNVYALSCQSKESKTASLKDIHEFMENIRERKSEKTRKKLRIVLQYAAAVLIAFFIGRFAFDFNFKQNTEETVYNEVIVPPGQMAQLSLSDGTSICLNSCSHLKYPSKFSKKERTVYLTGEAFFKVKHNEKQPFLVKTHSETVKVLGTTFNIMAYPNDLYQATLIEGSVAMVDSNNNQIAVLKPGQQFDQKNNCKLYSINQVNPDMYTSWKDGIYMFDHEKLGEIAERLERIFAVKIEFQDQEIANYKFTGKILRNFSIEQVLKIIKLTAPVDYSIRQNQDGNKVISIFADKKRLKDKTSGSKLKG